MLPAASVLGSVSQLAEDAAGYGYWAIFLVVAGDGLIPILPGETAIVAAAVLAANGSLSLPLVILAGAAGAVAGDTSAYWIGRAGHGPIRRSITRVAGAERLAAAERMVQRQGPALVFVGRFLPGIRIAINLSCGAGHMSFPRFLTFDILGGIVWAGQAALLGYFAGRAFADQLWVAFVVAFAVTGLVGAFVAMKERQRTRRERRGSAPPDSGPDDAPPSVG
jgi:membrane-associated protein